MNKPEQNFKLIKSSLGKQKCFNIILKLDLV